MDYLRKPSTPPKIHYIGLLFLFAFGSAHAQTLSASANFHSIGYKMSLPAGFDPDKTAKVQLRYQVVGSADWRQGFPPERVRIAGEDLFVGSLFNLEPGTEYRLEATLQDSFPTISTQILPVLPQSTRVEPLIKAGANIKWVSPTGSGTAYSEAAPGNLKTLLASGLLTCGTSVFLKGGQYSIGEMALTLNSDCSESNPINIMAAPGELPVLDGGIQPQLNWVQDPLDPKLYSAALHSEAAFSTLCLLDTQRLYPYPALDQIVIGPATHPYYLRALNLGEQGFVRDDHSIFIKTAAGTDPNTKTVTLSKFKSCLTVYGNNKQNHLNIKGITFRNYGKPTVLDFGATIYTCHTLDLRDVHHLTIDSCRFDWNDFAVYCSGNNSYTTIQHCSFKDQTGFWSHAQEKKSNDVYFLPLLGVVIPSTFGRVVENAAISMRSSTCSNWVLRNNVIDGLANATTSGFSGADHFVAEADFYNNTLRNCYDGFECDEQWTNLRVWNNDVGNMLAGISLAPPLGGPTYVFRNIFHHLLSRWNVQDDPYYIGCQPVTAFNLQGVGIKTNAGVQGDAALYFINNTFHTADTLGFVAFIWDNEWGKMQWINNIFSSESTHLMYMADAKGDSDFQLASERDNYYCPNGSLLEVKEVHGQFDCHNTHNAQEIESLIRDITGSNDVSILAPFQEDPQFVHVPGNDFRLQPGSLLINAGIALPGFYDYFGAAPDIGAKETAVVSAFEPVPALSELRLFPNPTLGMLEIQSSIPIQSATIFDAVGRQMLTQNSVQTIDLSGLPPGVYWVKVQAMGKILWGKAIKYGF